ncbi:thioredoxin family protein [Clostridiisalibacter paucivorans]|uniref:thioredoxin family protein n=1 Tax=Clostridiisalibacter paucivorans TaxID=408753 RepID=UPI00047E1A93|nr:thioredoxin family protein [Clostridiisalibacter paucivorans]
MDIKGLYNSGISFEDFVNRDSDTYREKTLEIYRNIEFNPSLIDRIKEINKKIKVLICAEIWCPDCMINVPIIEKMRTYNRNIEISIVKRDGNEEFFKAYLKTDVVKIPTFIFFDKNCNELGSFVEHPKKIKNIVAFGNQPNIIVAKRKYKKGEYAEETLKDILDIIL